MTCMLDGRNMIFMSMSNGLLSTYAIFFVTSWRHDAGIIAVVTYDLCSNIAIRPYVDVLDLVIVKHNMEKYTHSLPKLKDSNP